MAAALLGVEYLIPGITIDSFYTALIVAIVLGLLNVIVRPILFVLTLPITIITLGLFSFVLNAFLFWWAASFIEGFYVVDFMAALLGSLLVSLVSTATTKLL